MPSFFTRLYHWLLDRPLYKNSFIFFVGTITAGLGGYLYQLAMSRMLSLADFGALSSLVSVFGLVGVPISVVGTLTIRQVAALQAHGSLGSVSYLVRRLTQASIWGGGVLFLLFLLAGSAVKQYLQLDSSWPYYILIVGLPLSFITAIWQGVLPGLQRFRVFSTSQIIVSVLKLFLAIGFVFLSWGVTGAIGATLIASVVATVFVGWHLRDIFSFTPEPVTLAHLKTIAGVIFVWTLSLAALQSLDVILVKRFFAPDEAGVYAAFSLLGKIIFFGATSVAGVLLPMATELYEAGKHAAHRRLLRLSLGLTAGLAGLGVTTYWLVPATIIRIFLGARYLPFGEYLVWFGLLGFCLSVVQILAVYFLSIGRRWFLLMLALAPILEVVLVYTFHDSLLTVLKIFVAILAVLALSLFGVFRFARSEQTVGADI